MSRFKHHVVVAMRGFRRTPTFVVTVLLLLGLGVGMAVAISATYDAVLVRKLPVVEQDHIAVLWPYRVPGAELSPPFTDVQEFARQSRTMRGVAAVTHWGVTPLPLVSGNRTIVFQFTNVSSNFFDVLNAKPVLGRFLRREDQEPGAKGVMVISYGMWRSHFRGASDIIGQRVTEPRSQTQATIVGVAPPGLDYPQGVEAWSVIGSGASLRVFAVGRLAPGATLREAQAEYFSALSHLEASAKFSGVHAETFTEAVVGKARPILLTLAAAVGLLLLIGCVNLGSLFLVRASGRARELAIRRAVGATYGDLVAQLTIEGALLAIAAAPLALLCANVLLGSALRVARPELPRVDDIQLHANLLTFAIVASVVALVVFGVVPALVGAQVNLTSLRSEIRASSSRQSRAVRQGFVATQIALSLVMLAAAGVLTRTLVRLEHVPLGYRSDGLSILSLAFDARRYNSNDRVRRLDDEIEQRLRAVPGVAASSRIYTLPFSGAAINLGAFEAEDRALSDASVNTPIPWECGGPEYFETLGIPLIAGRGFRERDFSTPERIAVVSTSVAKRFWPDDNPIGKRLRFPPDPSKPTTELSEMFAWRTVVGVVGDTHYRAVRASAPAVYVPCLDDFLVYVTFAVRSANHATLSAQEAEYALKPVDSSMRVWQVQSLDQLLSATTAESRLIATLIGIFAMVAVALAGIGLYGTIASLVRERRREIGIRIALGATASEIRFIVLREALVTAALGAGAGIVCAIISMRALGGMLFDVRPIDPVSLGTVIVLLLGITALSSYLPSRRATRLNPIDVLRAD